MIASTLEHASASSLIEAAEIAASAQGRVALVAGGTDLLGTLKDHIHPAYPDVLIDIKPLAELEGIAVDRGGLKLGALTRLADVAADPQIGRTWPLLAEAARTVATPQIRNMATVGGNICQEPRCWYYRSPQNAFYCLRKGGERCGALLGDNRYHSIFGAARSGLPGCVQLCPAGVPVPDYMEQVRAGQVEAATRLILERNPMPAVTGRVCPHPCQSGCSRLDHDRPVATHAVERSLGDRALADPERFFASAAKESGKKVAVVGAGPAGLSAAYYLRRAGHAVTVYDREAEPGGMLRYSIPAYRLPRDVLEQQIDAYRRMGVVFVSGKELGRDFTLQDLRADCDGVFVATGGWQQYQLGLENEQLLSSGLDFLREVATGSRRLPGRNVLVIGGGSVAVDVAVTARRLGAAKVTMACLEAHHTMPAVAEDIEQALDEGIELLPTWGPHGVLVGDGRLKGMELVRCTSVFDREGRFHPSFDPDTKTIVEADAVLVAIGQGPDLSWVDGALQTAGGRLVADPDSQITSQAGVYAGGDVVTGASTVIAAVAAGRRAARTMAAAFGSAGDTDETASAYGMNMAALRTDDATPIEMLPVSERCIDQEDIAALSADAIEREAQRCLDCGCIAVNASDLAPALLALDARVVTTERTLPAAEFFAVGSGTTTVLAPGEIVTHIEAPAPPTGSVQGYRKFRVRNSVDFPILGLATLFVLEKAVFAEARVALGAVAPLPFRVTAAEEFLIGRAPTEEVAEAAAALAVECALPLTDNAFKVQLVRATVKEAILAAG
jgi:NADPH-dependent glutamate synthase beta subunit-like oxidoreductase/CO/xanthine dehydrogenase FAD-binding subunit